MSARRRIKVSSFEMTALDVYVGISATNLNRENVDLQLGTGLIDI